MEEIIVIRARDPDGSVFQAVMDSLKGKRAEVVDVAAPATSVLRIGELELHHKHRRVLMAGREVELNHGEYAMLYCMASSPGQRNIYAGQTPWRIPSGGCEESWRRNPGIRHTSRRWWGQGIVWITRIKKWRGNDRQSFPLFPVVKSSNLLLALTISKMKTV